MSEYQGWEKLKTYTSARVALERAGGSLTTQEALNFRQDHAFARDAVWAEMDHIGLAGELGKLGLEYVLLHSKASDRQTYVKRPDLGKQLDGDSVKRLKEIPVKSFDISITIADGLSALAIDRHVIEFLKAFLHLTPFTIAPVTVVRQGRVAISDQIGQLLHSSLSIILIGERPGLSSPDSLGIYMTYHPKTGNTDEKRNCISNIRKEGLSYQFASQKLNFLASEALRRKISGVNLKDTFDNHLLNNDGTKK